MPSKKIESIKLQWNKIYVLSHKLSYSYSIQEDYQPIAEVRKWDSSMYACIAVGTSKEHQNIAYKIANLSIKFCIVIPIYGVS